VSKVFLLYVSLSKWLSPGITGNKEVYLPRKVIREVWERHNPSQLTILDKQLEPTCKKRGMTSEEEKIQNYALFCIRMQLLHVHAYGAHMHTTTFTARRSGSYRF